MSTLAWLLFKLPDFDHVIAYIRAIFSNTGMDGLQPLILFFVLLFSIPVVAYHLLYLWTRTPRPAMARITPIIYGMSCSS